MDHLLAAFFALVFPHGVAAQPVAAQVVPMPSYARHYGNPSLLPVLPLPQVTANRRAGYAGASAAASHL